MSRRFSTNRHRSVTKYAPGDKDKLVPLACATLGLVLEVIHGPFALCLRKLADKCLVVGVAGGLHDDNLLQVIAETVDDVFVLLAELEFLEHLETLRADTDAGGLDIDIGS